MQRLEVSGAVRLIYRSLGVKRLTCVACNFVKIVVVDELENSRVFEFFFQPEVIFIVILQERDVGFFVSTSPLIADQFQ